jgi:hypothetical protein
MTASDIVYIVFTVAVTQALCDLAANKLVFSTDHYKDALSTLERMRLRRDKVLAQPASAPQTSSTQSKSNAKSMDKYKKRLKVAEEEFATASNNVSRIHIMPRVCTSAVFFFLYRILNTEYQGRIVALLPFEPWGLIRRFSMRGIQFSQGFDVDASFGRIQSTNQVCNFLFIYILCNMSVKFLVNLLLGTKKPIGTEKSLLDIVDDPRGKKILEELGVDTEEIRELRKNL